mmetsp:Transcript_6584/g.14587  ORF Transcript_6584/g.14587 Transcript_6584/m.14587 type:complete len:909 (+) Transcript_6584:87-2813(+)
MVDKTEQPTDEQEIPKDNEAFEYHPIVIIGGGIGGLVLALCLDQVYNHPTTSSSSSTSSAKKNHLPIHVYESTSAYTANAGGAIGLYSNGLRVLRHLSETHPALPSILTEVRSAGCDYLYRRWMRHDGTEVAVAREDELLPDAEEAQQEENAKKADLVGGLMDSDDDDDDDRSAKSGDTHSISSDASSSNPYSQQQRRPRGDSISSQHSRDKAADRADRRPRGGSFGSFRGSFRKGLGGRLLADPDATRPRSRRPSDGSMGSTEGLSSQLANLQRPNEVPQGGTMGLARTSAGSTSRGSMDNLKSLLFGGGRGSANSGGSGAGGGGANELFGLERNRRPRGDSISSRDEGAEIADLRPRGGTMGLTRTSAGSTSRGSLNSMDNLKSLLFGGGRGSANSGGSGAGGGGANELFGLERNRRPRGDSISSRDEGAEIADLRPRGGTMGLTRTSAGSTSRGSLNSMDNLKSLLFGGNGSGNSAAGGGGGANELFELKRNRNSLISTTSTQASRPTVEMELLSLGIRRWKYQQVLYEACVAAGIHIHFGKRLERASSVVTSANHEERHNNNTLLQFKDGSLVTASLLIGADGVNSKVRNYVTNPADDAAKRQKQEQYSPEYTGVTCLMGCANVPRVRGICFPSSATTKCHACYYPTRAPREGTDDDPSDYEQVFQIYFPSPVERPDTWRTLTPQEAKEECRELAKKLREDGWDEQFLAPLESPTLTGVLRVGLRSREALDSWHVGGNGNSEEGGASKEEEEQENVGRAVLLGDAAHPPVPYIGQGAMMAMEDAGTLSMILGRYCPIDADNDDATTLNFAQFSKAMSVYESLRVERTKRILGSSVQLGKTQQKRAESKLYNAWREMSIRAQVWAYGTLPVMRPGAAFDYRVVAEEALLSAEKVEEGGEVEQVAA